MYIYTYIYTCVYTYVCVYIHDSLNKPPYKKVSLKGNLSSQNPAVA